MQACADLRQHCVTSGELAEPFELLPGPTVPFVIPVQKRDHRAGVNEHLFWQIDSGKPCRWKPTVIPSASRTGARPFDTPSRSPIRAPVAACVPATIPICSD